MQPRSSGVPQRSRSRCRLPPALTQCLRRRRRRPRWHPRRATRRHLLRPIRPPHQMRHPVRPGPPRHLRPPTRSRRRPRLIPTLPRRRRSTRMPDGSTTPLARSASSCPRGGWNPTPLTSTTARRCSARSPGRPAAGQPPPVANDTRVVLGKLDQKLYASAEPDNTKAATRLASDMGEFFMPYPGTRVNQETTALSAKGMSGGASFYEVKFSDASKPNGQIWAGVIGPSGPNVAAGRGEPALVRGVAGHWERPGGQGGSHDAGRIRPSAAGPPGCTSTRPGRTGSGTRSGRSGTRTRSAGHRLRHPLRAHRLRLLRRERRAPHLRRRRHRHPDSPPVGTARHRLRARSPPSERLWPACSQRHHLLRNVDRERVRRPVHVITLS